ncbi:hypothetical protein O6H91_02G008800 [Diphasiastrum complanatum]|uniref:Uncharacterized protein n=1 Tax=Diphasiastrum complanatum TaxID=34168 RepID=A0ACC2ECE7_DIPCM|nr:hypothetical protein O6H91_02G008800 [Diphasiastrum complanatum]
MPSSCSFDQFSHPKDARPSSVVEAAANARSWDSLTDRMAVPVMDELEISDPEANDASVGRKKENWEKGALPLPEAFLKFLKQNQIDPSVYKAAQSLPRYIRFKPSINDEISSIEKDIGTDIKPVSWLPGFFYIAPKANIAGSEAYKHGKIYGMDAASGAAVTALEVSPGDHVLDICAAPDIAQHRLAACRTMLQKYGLGNRCRLFLADGTTFSLLPLAKPNAISHMDKQPENTSYSQNLHLSCLHTNSENEGKKGYDYHAGIRSTVLKEWVSRKTRKEKHAEKRARFFEEKRQQACHLLDDTAGGEQPKLPEIFFYGTESGMLGMEQSEVLNHTAYIDAVYSQNGYDKVLVDAECTHDGSLKHISKFEQWGWDTFEHRFFNVERISSIADLQLQLLLNGFRLLKLGGSLVYSTCSFTFQQNESVVERFLAAQPNAELKQIEASKEWPCRVGGLMHTLRFDPFVSNTNGLFVAKIIKTRSAPTKR